MQKIQTKNTEQSMSYFKRECKRERDEDDEVRTRRQGGRFVERR